MATGIRYRHSRSCTNHDACDKKCGGDKPWEAWVYHKREKVKERQSFATQAAARGWRTDAVKEVKDKKRRPPTARTLGQEVEAWLDGARAGSILNKREQPYK